MDRPSSESSTLPWFWIIEYLTSFQLVPTGILYVLIKEAPPFPDDLKGKVDELVALRCLEELCSVGYEPSASDVALGEKVGIDLSKTCQDVLACILQEASVSDIMTKAKPLRWDIKPFILHKRAAMPKTSLQRIKDANFDGQQGRDKSEFLLSNKKRKMTCNLDSENLANNLHEGQQSWDDFDHFTDDQFRQFLHDAFESAAANESGRPDDLLRSQYPQMGDSLFTDDRTAQNVCVKCKKSDQLLVCRTESCSLAVHEKCLGFLVTLDETGNFYCPFCCYSTAAKEYRESMKDASLLKKDMAGFML